MKFILLESLAIFLLVGALAGMAVSLMLIFRPHLLERIGSVANRWISTRRMNRLLDRSIDIEYWFYRHHRLFGIAAVLGAGYIMAYFGLLFDKAIALQHLSAYASARLLDGLLDALVLASLSGAAVALFVGLFLWLRPSLLRGIEESSNQWISLRRPTRQMDIPRDQVERFVAGHTRGIGWLLLLGSLYLFFAVLRILV